MKRMMISVIVVPVLFALTGMTLPDTPAEESTVHWMTFEEAVAKSKTEKKKIFIDVYTDWCGWCKVMDKKTFQDPLVAKLLNEKFYPVKFNAEQREDLVFDGHTFKFIASGNSGYHELAASLLDSKLSYPTVVFLNEDFQRLFPLPGYREAPEFHKILSFVAGEYYLKGKTAWEDFGKIYKSPYANP